MIRVLHVIGVMDRGGAETMIMNLYRAIDRSKIQFDFLVHEQREADYDAEIRNLGGQIFRLPRFTGFNIHTYRRQARIFFTEHPVYKVVHGHIGSSAPIYLNEAKRVGSYTIAHSHSQNCYESPASLAFNLVAYPVRYIADYFMACSREAGLDRFGSAIAGSERFAVLPNGVDVSLYACNQEKHEMAKEKLGFAGRPIVCHAGRLVPLKNHAFLLDVFALVHKRLPDAVLLCAGRGELENSLKDRVAELGLQDAVQFLGVVDNVPELLRAADMFIFPSIKEGLSMAVIEAQASGVPAIISTGVPELAMVSDRVWRIPLDEGVDAWAKICFEKLSSGAQGDRSDACAQVRAAGFDIGDTACRLGAFYEKVALGQRACY